jgi:hypothetical protein
MITITIDSIDRTSSVVFKTISKVDNLNQQVDNLRFGVRKYGSLTYSPTLNDEVIVALDGTRLFGGVIVKIDEVVTAKGIIDYTVTSNDYSQYLKRKLVTERYESMTVKAIIDDLIANYATDFTDTNTVTGLTIDSISFNRLTVADCLEKLAKAISYVWYVDYYKDIHFFPKNTEVAPFNITDTSENYIRDSLKIIEDLTQMRNTVLVQGGETESTATRTETIAADGTNTQYTLINKFSVVPVVTVNAVAKTVGTEFLDSDASYQCMWNYNQKYIRFTAGNTPTAGQTITVTAKYLYPIVVRVTAPSSIALFGTYEFAISDKTIQSQQEAIDRAQAELQTYQNQLYNGEFSTHESDLRSGQVINITSTLRSKNIDVLIQSVVMVPSDPDGNIVEYKVTFATLRDIGIIEFLQNQLRDKEILVGDTETLLNLFNLSDEIQFSDVLSAPTTDSPPYVYGPDAGNVGVYGFATYS